MISNEQNPSELHLTEKGQKVNIEIDRDLQRRTEYIDDRYDDLDDKNYVKHPIKGQTQDSYLYQSPYKPNPVKSTRRFTTLGLF